MYVDATGEACPAIIGVNFMTHPESSIANEQNAGGSVVFESNTRISSGILTIQHWIRFIHDNGGHRCLHSQSSDLGYRQNRFLYQIRRCRRRMISSLKSEYDVIKLWMFVAGGYAGLFKTPKYKLFGLKRHAYEWTEISHEQHLKLASTRANAVQLCWNGLDAMVWF